MALAWGFHTGGLVVSGLAAVIALGLAIIVVRASPAAMNRRLALLLVADALFMVMAIVSTLLVGDDPTAPLRVPVGIVVAFDAVALLLFLGTFDSPIGRAFHRPVVGTLVIAGGILSVVATVVGLVQQRSLLGFGNVEGPAWMLLAVSSILGLLVSIDAYRRTETGTAAHRRAGAAALAFVTREGTTAVFVALWAVSDLRGWDGGKAWAEMLGGVAIGAFCILLAYGVLRTQLYDIDLKVRWGIQKGTIVGVIVAVAFVGEKLAEQILSREFGWVVGSVLAGLLVFAAPRLNKLGDKVAERALPEAKPTSEYLAFKKLEVYRAAVETAMEDDGVIDAKERALLVRLRGKLSLAPHDAEAIERELSEAGG